MSYMVLLDVTKGTLSGFDFVAGAGDRWTKCYSSRSLAPIPLNIQLAVSISVFLKHFGPFNMVEMKQSLIVIDWIYAVRMSLKKAILSIMVSDSGWLNEMLWIIPTWRASTWAKPVVECLYGFCTSLPYYFYKPFQSTFSARLRWILVLAINHSNLRSIRTSQPKLLRQSYYVVTLN